ncbi:hypothetical protein BpHYR1_049502 [Brachionus plicatilis]|uniref:Uncharacterized protein n=1 Tax=Brachionus plicatilis TaxID=10195 RepID=A0A3M7RE87_BRAPC|nr:hypothetical protein BpHYR1_049502 [Brachionus plicatilis]
MLVSEPRRELATELSWPAVLLRLVSLVRCWRELCNCWFCRLNTVQNEYICGTDIVISTKTFPCSFRVVITRFISFSDFGAFTDAHPRSKNYLFKEIKILLDLMTSHRRLNESIDVNSKEVCSERLEVQRGVEKGCDLN